MTITPSDLETCLRVLKQLEQNPDLCMQPDSEFASVQRAAAGLGKAVKRRLKAVAQERDRDLRDESGLRETRRVLRKEVANINTEAQLNSTPAETQHRSSVRLAVPHNCYVCKKLTDHAHTFYETMCPTCGAFNFEKRNQSADLANRTALVTGGRIKIGFQIGLKLLRAGANLIVTTRFPVDAAERYSAKPDCCQWQDRLRIFGVDFRSLPGLEQLAQQIVDEYDELDVLINNSAQTIRRPPAFYEHVWKKEQSALQSLAPEARRLLANAESFSETQKRMTQSPAESSGAVSSLIDHPHVSSALSQIPLLPDDVGRGDFPAGQFDEHGQQIDLRPRNSWIARVPDISFVELLEVHAVNTFAPFYLLQRLEPLLMKNIEIDRFVVNVSAMEGRFNHFKDGRHPHTNMAKAALNMLTRTCGEDYAKRRLYMNSVDTGWVTNEFPHSKVTEMQDDGFEPPLDEIDGAARVVDPVFATVNGAQPVFGKFLKDYRTITW